MTTEAKLGQWAAAQGIDWPLARTMLIPGDAEAFAEQLRYAREQKSEADKSAVRMLLRMYECRARAVVEGAKA